MSIVIPAGHSRTGVPLAGAATASGTVGRRARLGGVLASYVVATVLTAASAWAAGGAPAGSARAEMLWQLSCAWVVAACVLTAVWTRGVAFGARACGVPNVRPGRMALAWLVPLIGPPAAIRQIGRLLRELDYSERRLGFWMFALYAHTAVLLAGSVVVAIGFNGPEGAVVRDALEQQASLLWLQAAMSAVLTVLAMRAVLHADRALIARRR